MATYDSDNIGEIDGEEEQTLTSLNFDRLDTTSNDAEDITISSTNDKLEPDDPIIETQSPGSDIEISDGGDIQFTIPIRIRTVQPSKTDINIPITVTVKRDVTVPVATRIYESLKDYFTPVFENYYDQQRVGKTLLNYRSDEQYPALNWKSSDNNRVALKLRDPLPSDKSSGDWVHVSRELENSYFDVIKFIDLDVQPIPQLRPSSPNISKISPNKKITATLSELIPEIAGGSITITSGSVTQSSNYSNFVTNHILEKYYNINRLNAGLINVDYDNFSNFVTFSSATKRIDVFKSKLEEIEKLVNRAPIFIDQLNITGSAAQSGSYDTVFGTLEIDASGSASLSLPNSSTYAVATGSFTSTDYVNSAIVISKQIQELIRTFDDYEKTLWFAENLPYSASDSTNYHENSQYLDDYTYPKILGIPYSTTSDSASVWYQELSSISDEYDDRNENTLSKNIPMYLQDDKDSIDFSTFVDMVGHHFDNIKLYIQNTENLYSRYPKVDKELSGQLTTRVLESFGVTVPGAASVENLLRYVTGETSGSVAQQLIADEYYKRYMHALPFLLKTKGTKQSVNSLLNVFGINPNFITIHESLNNRLSSLQSAKTVSEEQNLSLLVVSGSYLSVPMSASLRTPKTIQARLALKEDKDQSVLVFGDGSYTLNAILHPSSSVNDYYQNIGRFELVSSSVSLMTSSYFDLFDNEFVSVQLQSGSSGVQLDIGKVEDESMSFSQSLVEPELSMSIDWPTLDYVYVGSPVGSSSLGYSTFSLDEFRLWGELTETDVFYDWVEHPGSYYGNGTASGLAFLYVLLNFTIPPDVGTDGHVINSTYYRDKTDPLDLSVISASNFPVESATLYNTERIIRTSIEKSYKFSPNTPTTQMVRIAPDAPVSGTLSSNSSLNSPSQKNVSGSWSTADIDISISPIDSIDREIYRFYGDFDIARLISDPLNRTNYRYPKLENISNIFLDNVSPTVDYNAFLRYFDKFLKMFNEVVDDYLPARARVTKGITIRSHVLDRNKINNRTNILFSGETARRNEDLTEPKDVVRSYDVKYHITESLSTDVQGDFNTIEAGLSLPSYNGNVNELYTPLAEQEDYSGSIIIRSITELESEIGGGYDQDGFTDLFFNLERSEREQELQPLYDPTSDNKTEIAGDVIVVGPVDDLFDRKLTNMNKFTYFTSEYGLYYFDTKRLVPITESFMSSQPTATTWSAGSTYTRGDVVLQPIGLTGSDGKEFSKNGKYFVFTDLGYPGEPYVTSSNVPQLDTQLWTSLRYRPQIYQKLKRVAYVNNNTGSLSILSDLTASYTSVPTEYTEDRSHFRFHREQSLGARRRMYLGTLNTVEGTADGKKPYQVFDLNINEIQVAGPDSTSE